MEGLSYPGKGIAVGLERGWKNMQRHGVTTDRSSLQRLVNREVAPYSNNEVGENQLEVLQ